MKTDKDGRELRQGDAVQSTVGRGLFVKSFEGPFVVVSDGKGNTWGLYPDEVRLRKPK